jgi:hypothetical protein
MKIHWIRVLVAAVLFEAVLIAITIVIEPVVDRMARFPSFWRMP